MSLRLTDLLGVQPELKDFLARLGAVGVPFGTPVNAAAAQAVLAAADLAIAGNGDVVSFLGVNYVKAAVPGVEEWDDAAALAGLLNVLTAWNAAAAGGAVTITGATRGVWGNGNVATITVLEDTTAGGGAGTKASAAIAAATIARLAIGDTVGFAGSVFTMAAATSVQDNEFADQAGLIACIDALADWTAVDNAGAIDIEAAANGEECNDLTIMVSLRRTTAGGVDGTPGVRGAVCVDAGFIYVCTATDETLTNNNWERVAIAAF